MVATSGAGRMRAKRHVWRPERLVSYSARSASSRVTLHGSDCGSAVASFNDVAICSGASGRTLATVPSARNVKPVRLATASDVNTEQLLAFEKILVTDGALAKLAERTSASGKSATGQE